MQFSCFSFVLFIILVTQNCLDLLWTKGVAQAFSCWMIYRGNSKWANISHSEMVKLFVLGWNQKYKPQKKECKQTYCIYCKLLIKFCSKSTMTVTPPKHEICVQVKTVGTVSPNHQRSSTSNLGKSCTLTENNHCWQKHPVAF